MVLCSTPKLASVAMILSQSIGGALPGQRLLRVVIPTGYGKSLCYQLIPFLFVQKRGKSAPKAELSVVIVVSPLVSLMVEGIKSPWSWYSCCSPQWKLMG